MTDQSPISPRMMSGDTSERISSPELQDGSLPYRCQDTPDLFVGPAVAPASPSPRPEKAKHQAMNATYGPSGLSLSEQFDRQSFLVSKLRRQLDGAGSTLFTLTWNRKATPYGRPYFQLAASARRTGETDFGLLQSEDDDESV